MNQKGFAAPILIGVLILALLVVGFVVLQNKKSEVAEPTTEQTSEVSESTDNMPVDTAPIVPVLPKNSEVTSYDDATLDAADAQMTSLDADFSTSSIDSLTFE